MGNLSSVIFYLHNYLLCFPKVRSFQQTSGQAHPVRQMQCAIFTYKIIVELWVDIYYEDQLHNFFKVNFTLNKARAWCKTFVTTSFYIRSYCNNSFAPSPRKAIFPLEPKVHSEIMREWKGLIL